MAAKKSKANNNPGGLGPLLYRGRWGIVALLFAIVVAVGWRMAWDKVSDHVLAEDDYRVTPDKIAIDTLPPWIHCDLKAEVMRDASLERSLSLLDADLTKRLANAFSLHPWVARVDRVSKHHPARVEVHLVYRRPVAMVEVSGGLLPVDEHGILLPSADFSPAEAKQYPRISRVESHPSGPVGANWGDANVSGGARIATILAGRWKKLRLYRILAPVQTGADSYSDRYTYELVTHAGTRLLWGRPPGNEPTGELKAGEKVVQLEQIVQRDGSLDGPSGPRIIDLRTASSTPRTAVKSLPGGEAQ